MRTNASESRGAAKVLGRFHCQEALESAAPFVSYRARTQGLAGFERVFALKTLPADAQPSRPDATQRLLEIASRSTSVRDPRIGQVVDSGTAPDGTAYVATEFLFGAHLGALRGGLVGEANGEKSLPTLLIAHVAAEIAAALAAAHELTPPLVHAGLTPNNVFVTIRGAVKVVDFGHRAAVLPGRLAGGKRFLSAYAAPELLLAGEGSEEADVFALASLLFELATGKTPPSARNPRSATDLARALSGLPPDLAEVLVSLLRADPAKRPPARQAERAFRLAASELSETELRAHLGALARRLSLPQTAAVQAQDSAVMPSLASASVLSHPAACVPSSAALAMPTNKLSNTAGASPPPIVLAPAPSAPTKRERGRKRGKSAAPVAPPSVPAAAPIGKAIEPMHTLPFSQLFDGQGGATPQAVNHTGPTAEMQIDVAGMAVAIDLAPKASVTEASAMFELSLTDLESLGSADAEPTVSGNSYDAVRARLTAELQAESPPAPVAQKLAALPMAGEAPAADRPNMSNLTTSELEAMFAPGLAQGLAASAAEGASAPQASLPEACEDDFLDDAKTNAFDRRRLGNLLADAETPVRPPPPMAEIFPPPSVPTDDASAEPLPWMADERDAPGGFQAALREGTAEVDDAQLVSAEFPEPEVPNGSSSAADLTLSQALSDDAADLKAEELEARPPRRRRFVITLATAALVALVAGVLGGGMLIRKKSSPPRSARAPGAAEQAAPLLEKVVKGAQQEEPAKEQARLAAPPAELAQPSPKPEAANPTSSVAASGGPAPRDAKGRYLVNMQTNPPGAQIWINGGARGVTPATIELKERHRSLVLVLAGYQRFEEDLDHQALTAQRTWSLQPAVPPAPGSAKLSVQCEKQGKYPIAINGVETGLLCPAELSVAPGEYEVSVYVPWRFKSYPSRVVANAGQTKTVAYAK